MIKTLRNLMNTNRQLGLVDRIIIIAFLVLTLGLATAGAAQAAQPTHQTAIASATYVFNGYGYLAPSYGPMCNADVDAAGRLNGQGWIQMPGVPFNGSYSVAPQIWGPAPTLVSYTPVLAVWTASGWANAGPVVGGVAQPLRLGEIAGWSNGTPPLLPANQGHFMINSHGYYKVAILYRWYHNGVLVKSLTDWYGHDKEQYWDATGSNSAALPVDYCTF